MILENNMPRILNRKGIHCNRDGHEMDNEIKMEGTRGRGRQRTRWVDLVGRDAKELGIPNWRLQLMIC
uniref:Uncharacterized protein n=1 Tax=Megaselia scalaris TaxID=36166 RepID=T1GLZ7_MEGSC